MYFTSETVFYSGNLSFSAEKLSLSPVFSNGKDRFIRKIQDLTPKTRFSRGTEYFTCEIVFYSGNLSFSIEKMVAIPFFFPVEKTVLLKKIQVLTPKTRFARGKVYFTSEIVFYSGNLIFSRENLVTVPGFFQWKRSFC